MFSYLYSVKEKTGSTIIIIATTVGGVVFPLCIVLIVLLITYEQRKRASKLSSPVNIQLADATPKESLPIDQVNYLRMFSLELIESPSIYKVSLV